MGERNHQRVDRGYDRSKEKSDVYAAVDEYYDASIASAEVGGGDPGVAMLMAGAAEAAAAQQDAEDTDAVFSTDG